MDFFDIIKSQVITEKTQAIESVDGITKYVFNVSERTNKTQVKKAFKSRFNQVPSKINIIVVKNKKKKFRNKYFSFCSYKKVIVTFDVEVKFALDEKVYS